MSKYYLIKQGVYQQGVFWIGDNYEQAITEAAHHALNDDDNYHSWEIIEYSYGFENEVAYSINKFQALALKAPPETFSSIDGRE
jgi:hypothetical protein